MESEGLCQSLYEKCPVLRRDLKEAREVVAYAEMFLEIAEALRAELFDGAGNIGVAGGGEAGRVKVIGGEVIGFKGGEMREVRPRRALAVKVRLHPRESSY